MSDQNETPNESPKAPEETSEVKEETPQKEETPTVVYTYPETRRTRLINAVKSSRITYVCAGVVGTVVALFVVAAVSGESTPKTDTVSPEPLALPVGETAEFDMSVFEMETN